MAEFDWHADRSDLDGLALLDRTQEDTGIDLAAVRAWRQGRVRREMAVREIDAVILMDPVNIRYARRRSISMRRATGAGPGSGKTHSRADVQCENRHPSRSRALENGYCSTEHPKTHPRDQHPALRLAQCQQCRRA